VAVETRGYAKGRATRRQIVEEATALFAEVGYRSASLREIAARCGISHTGLLHHFPSKQLLLAAVLERRDEVDREWLELERGEGVEALARLVALVERNAQRRNIVELFTTLSAEATSSAHPGHRYFVDRYRETTARFSQAYGEARQAGALLDGIDPDSAGRQLAALMDGLQVQWLLDPASDMPRLVREHVECQLRVPLPKARPQ